MLKILTQGKCKAPWFLLDPNLVTDPLRMRNWRGVTLTEEVMPKKSTH